MPIRDLNLGVWFYVFEYLTPSELLNFGLTCKLACVFHARQRTFQGSPVHSSSRFLPAGAAKDRVALVSYPRCGNSFLRSVLEERTRIVTGSDSAPLRSLSAELLKCGYAGEGVTDSSCWIVKSHYPERVGFVRFEAQRAVVLVRNPFDSLLSYFHMGMTNTHNRTLSVEAFLGLDKEWAEFVESEIKVWFRFYQYWKQQFEEKGESVLFVRFEDLVSDREESVKKIMEFLYSSGDLVPEGYKVAADGKLCRRGEASHFSSDENISVEQSPGYERRAQVGFGASLAHFKGAQIEMIIASTESILEYFGYDVGIRELSYSVLTDSEKLSWILTVNPLQLGCKPITSFETNRDTGLYSAKQAQIHRTVHKFNFNVPPDIRGDEIKFGRNFTAVRKGLTDNDKIPFELRPAAIK